MKIRQKLWVMASRKQQEGKRFPPWLLAIRAILFPLDFFYWRMGQTRGYDLATDEWTIHGVRYTSAALIALARAEGEVYRVKKIGGCVTLERIEPVSFPTPAGNATSAMLHDVERMSPRASEATPRTRVSTDGR